MEEDEKEETLENPKEVEVKYAAGIKMMKKVENKIGVEGM